MTNFVLKAYTLSKGKGACKPAGCPTKRAPDAGESAAISGSFLRLIIFLAGRLRRPHPSAGNANRWLAGSHNTN